MDLQRGILFLYDPEKGNGQLPQLECSVCPDMRSVRYADAVQCLSEARSMLYALHSGFAKTCIAAEGRSCCIALALAAQLMVDRLVLCGPDIFAAQTGGTDRDYRRIESFAVRNMSLNAAEIILVGVDGAQMRALIRMLGRRVRGNVRIADPAEIWLTGDFAVEMAPVGSKVHN